MPAEFKSFETFKPFKSLGMLLACIIRGKTAIEVQPLRNEGKAVVL